MDRLIRRVWMAALLVAAFQGMASDQAVGSLYLSDASRDAARDFGLQGTGSRIFGFRHGETGLSSATYFSTVGSNAYFLITGHQIFNRWHDDNYLYTITSGPNAFTEPGETRTFTKSAITVFDGYLERTSGIDLAIVRVPAFAGITGTVAIGTANIGDDLDVYGFGRTGIAWPIAEDYGQDGFAYGFTAPVYGDWDVYYPENPLVSPVHYFGTDFLEGNTTLRHGNARGGDSGGAAYLGDSLVGLTSAGTISGYLRPNNKTGYLRLDHPDVQAFISRVVPTAVVPEPASIASAAIGIGGLLMAMGLRRRRRAATLRISGGREAERRTAADAERGVSKWFVIANSRLVRRMGMASVLVVLLQGITGNSAIGSVYLDDLNRDAARDFGLQRTGSRIFGFRHGASALSSATYYSTVGSDAYFLITGHQIRDNWLNNDYAYTITSGPNAFTDPGETRTFTKSAITVFDGYLERTSGIDLAIVRVPAFAGITGTVAIGAESVGDILDVYGFGHTGVAYAVTPIDYGQDGYAYGYSAPVYGDFTDYNYGNPLASGEYLLGTRFSSFLSSIPRHGNGLGGDSGGAAYLGDTLVGVTTSGIGHWSSSSGRTGYLRLAHPDIEAFIQRVVPTAVVPEPASIASAAIGIGGGLLIWRKRRRLFA